MSTTQKVTTDSFKEAVNRNPQPGLEAVYLPPPGVTYALHSPPLPEKPVKSTGATTRRVNFWLLLAVGVLGLAVIGLAVGLGVGLSRDDSNSASAQSAKETTSDPSPSPSPTSNNTDDSNNSTYTTTITETSTPSATTTSTPSPSSVCPEKNNALLTPSLGAIRYRVHCDSDLSGSGKETLASIVLGSFDECLALCNTMNYFQDRTDVGCTYNVAGTGTQTPGTCWCLGGEGVSVVENVGNDVAVPVS
ncbi:uncharacterized protein BJX67DRAFT_378838 [Aspergillus lucknowensis]|uniref:Apple domain-containing protein n=1 Tax=Aspergillus lucknowensis TaxID=176173 RepID=A0ABR4LZ23_9EURO